MSQCATCNEDISLHEFALTFRPTYSKTSVSICKYCQKEIATIFAARRGPFIGNTNDEATLGDVPGARRFDPK